MPDHKYSSLPITVLLAAKNEEANLPKCLAALSRVQRIVLLDSHSTDRTIEIAESYGAEVVQFDYQGGYPKKRQWALENIPIHTEWIMLLDADEVVTAALWDEIAAAIPRRAASAFLITKGFHFMGKPFSHGGFSFAALLLFRRGAGRFEQLIHDDKSGLDMEVHERVIVDGTIASLKAPLVHDDFKGLEAYIDRHNKYSTWEARLRHRYLSSGKYGYDTIKPTIRGNAQELRRLLKGIAVRAPFEPTLWFLYHYVFRLGFLEGRRGFIAARLRSQYISQVRAKMYELDQTSESTRSR